MTETRILKLGLIDITLAVLTQQQLVRIMHQPLPEGETLPEPVPPEGYTHDQAISLVEGYRLEWESREGRLATIAMIRRVGTARALALDSNLVPDTEKAALAKLCKRYAFRMPDEADDPYQIGMILYEIISDLGDPLDLLEADIWLRNKGGFLSDESVENILKSLRRKGESETDQTGSGTDQPQEQSKEPAADYVVQPI